MVLSWIVGLNLWIRSPTTEPPLVVHLISLSSLGSPSISFSVSPPLSPPLPKFVTVSPLLIAISYYFSLRKDQEVFGWAIDTFNKETYNQFLRNLVNLSALCKQKIKTIIIKWASFFRLDLRCFVGGLSKTCYRSKVPLKILIADLDIHRMLWLIE